MYSTRTHRDNCCARVDTTTGLIYVGDDHTHRYLWHNLKIARPTIRLQFVRELLCSIQNISLGTIWPDNLVSLPIFAKSRLFAMGLNLSLRFVVVAAIFRFNSTTNCWFENVRDSIWMADQPKELQSATRSDTWKLKILRKIRSSFDFDIGPEVQVIWISMSTSIGNHITVWNMTAHTQLHPSRTRSSFPPVCHRSASISRHLPIIPVKGVSFRYFCQTAQHVPGWTMLRLCTDAQLWFQVKRYTPLTRTRTSTPHLHPSPSHAHHSHTAALRRTLRHKQHTRTHGGTPMYTHA
jgi:hypothetical protein